MAVSMACLLFATTLAVALGRFEQRAHAGQPTAVIGGGVLEGATEVFRSKYLLLICLMMLTHNLTSTFLYNGLAVLVDRSITGFDARTEFFSYVDFVVQVIAFTFQFLITSRLLTWLGMPRSVVLPPLLLAGGFIILGSAMGLVLFAAVQVAQRSMNYGLLGPIKEMLFTVVDRQTKYKSKNFIDTVVYRGSDVSASWLFKLATSGAGLSLTQLAWLYLPVMAFWGWGAWTLGRAFERREDQLREALKDG
jgi:AAA family ATP:ADP antiporter